MSQASPYPGYGVAAGHPRSPSQQQSPEHTAASPATHADGVSSPDVADQDPVGSDAATASAPNDTPVRSDSTPDQTAMPAEHVTDGQQDQHQPQPSANGAMHSSMLPESQAGSEQKDRQASQQRAGITQSYSVEVEELRPALIRQETEGGMMLLAALLRCMQSSKLQPPATLSCKPWAYRCGVKELRPALIRQETEGGMMLLAALTRCIQSGNIRILACS